MTPIGRPGANYDIRRSLLPPITSECLLEKASITAGKYITGGVSFSLGVRETSVHVSQKSYPMKLRFFLSRFFVFWDAEEKRGWLVNGLDTLLHLIRATFQQYETDVMKTWLLSKSTDISEPSSGTKDGSYALTVLLDEKNMKLPIYADKDGLEGSEDDNDVEDEAMDDQSPSSRKAKGKGKRKRSFYRLEDRVEALCEVLDQLIDH